MPLYKEQGIVLRTMKLGEADRIVTLLTQGSGKVRAVAKGVRKTRSKFGARLDPFTHVDLLLYKGRDLDIVTQAEIITSFREIRDSYDRFAAGETILEAIDRVAQEHERSVRTFMLLLGALRQLAQTDEPPVVVDAFLLRLVALAGFRPHFSACASCGTPGPHMRFSVAQGGMVCESCRSGAAVRLAEATPPYLATLMDDHWSADAPDDVRREGSGLVRAFVEYHFDRPLRAWSHMPR
ncbi:MAG: DNA repair protein RecO [Actinomycetota bacterium]|nr:DNA repair protein RecO [Actinomycetota bacterium]